MVTKVSIYFVMTKNGVIFSKFSCIFAPIKYNA